MGLLDYFRNKKATRRAKKIASRRRTSGGHKRYVDEGNHALNDLVIGDFPFEGDEDLNTLSLPKSPLMEVDHSILDVPTTTSVETTPSYVQPYVAPAPEPTPVTYSDNSSSSRSSYGESFGSDYGSSDSGGSFD